MNYCPVCAKAHRPHCERTLSQQRRRGGIAMSKKFGKDHMREIGRRGGVAVLEKYGREHFKMLRRKGVK